jgi:hypothetical protein
MVHCEGDDGDRIGLRSAASRLMARPLSSSDTRASLAAFSYGCLPVLFVVSFGASAGFLFMFPEGHQGCGLTRQSCAYRGKEEGRGCLDIVDCVITSLHPGMKAYMSLRSVSIGNFTAPAHKVLYS